jgi:hypothetical protein
VDAVKRALAEGRRSADATDTVSLDVEGVKQALAAEEAGRIAGGIAGGDALAETTQLPDISGAVADEDAPVAADSIAGTDSPGSEAEDSSGDAGSFTGAASSGSAHSADSAADSSTDLASSDSERSADSAVDFVPSTESSSGTGLAADSSAESSADTETSADISADSSASTSTDLVPAADPSTDLVPAPGSEADHPVGAYLASTDLSTSASTLVAVPETADDVIATINAAATAVAEADRRARRASVVKADPWTGLDLHKPAAPEPVDDVLDLLSPVLERPLLVVEQPGLPAAADVVALHRSELEVDFVEPPVVAAGAEPPIPPRYGPGLSVLPHIDFPV